MCFIFPRPILGENFLNRTTNENVIPYSQITMKPKLVKGIGILILILGVLLIVYVAWVKHIMGIT